MPANFRIELGPCDDVGRLYVNGREIATTGLDEVRRATRVLEDGDYNVRLEVLNPGLWAWRAALRLSGDNYEILAVDEKGARVSTAEEFSTVSGRSDVRTDGST
jgi:hypothetical protein